MSGIDLGFLFGPAMFAVAAAAAFVLVMFLTRRDRARAEPTARR